MSKAVTAIPAFMHNHNFFKSVCKISLYGSCELVLFIVHVHVHFILQGLPGNPVVHQILNTFEPGKAQEFCLLKCVRSWNSRKTWPSGQGWDPLFHLQSSSTGWCVIVWKMNHNSIFSYCLHCQVRWTVTLNLDYLLVQEPYRIQS